MAAHGALCATAAASTPFDLPDAEAVGVVELATLADLAEIVGAATVVGGIAFALYQIHHFRRQRQETAALEFIRAMQTPEFLQAEQVVWALPEGLTGEEFCAQGAAAERAAVVVGTHFENLGVMVHRGILPFDLVQDLVNTTVQVTWRHLAGYVTLTRQEVGSQSPYEWFQWLAERLAEHEPAHKRLGAHVVHRDWRPPGGSRRPRAP